MSKYQKQDFTDETGEQAILSVHPELVHTVIISGSNVSADDIDLEIVVQSPRDTAPERFKLEVDVLATSGSSPYIKKIDSPIQGIAIDIDANTSESIAVRVLSAQQ